MTPGETPDVLAQPQDYRGQRLGLPATGPGSITAVWRRVVALLVDWASALVVVGLFIPVFGGGASLPVLAVFAVQTTVLQWLMGSSFGQRLTGVVVVRVDGGQLGILPLLARTALICLVVPPLVWDQDTRGLHDKAAGTVCVLR